MILGIDTSAKVAACAVLDGGDVVASGVINNGYTHTQTLLPLIKSVLSKKGITLGQIDAFAVTNGPGSFTGIRIGVSMVKGLAHALGKPCIPVSSLLSLAYNLTGYDGIICAVMDARCNQVYNANFRYENGEIIRLCDDRAIAIADLISELKGSGKVTLVGDGAELVHAAGENFTLSPAEKRLQSGISVCLAADANEVSANELKPAYLRLPQAERERLAKINRQ